MKLLILFLVLLPLILIETTVIPLVFTLSIVFASALIIKSGEKYFIAFSSGLLFDLLTGKAIGLTDFYFLTLLLILPILFSFLPENLASRFFFFLIAEAVFLIINGLVPSILLLISGMLIFQIIFSVFNFWFKKENNQQLEFDFLTSKPKITENLTSSDHPRYFKRNRI